MSVKVTKTVYTTSNKVQSVMQIEIIIIILVFKFFISMFRIGSEKMHFTTKLHDIHHLAG